MDLIVKKHAYRKEHLWCDTSDVISGGDIGGESLAIS